MTHHDGVVDVQLPGYIGGGRVKHAQGGARGHLIGIGGRGGHRGGDPTTAPGKHILSRWRVKWVEVVGGGGGSGRRARLEIRRRCGAGGGRGRAEGGGDGGRGRRHGAQALLKEKEKWSQEESQEWLFFDERFRGGKYQGKC